MLFCIHFRALLLIFLFTVYRQIAKTYKKGKTDNQKALSANQKHVIKEEKTGLLKELVSCCFLIKSVPWLPAARRCSHHLFKHHHPRLTAHIA